MQRVLVGLLPSSWEGGFGVDFWLGFAFTAMQVRIVFDLILFRLQGQGGSVWEVYLWVVFDYAEATWFKMMLYSLEHSRKIAEVGPKMAPT